MTASAGSFSPCPSLPIPIFLNPYPQPRYLLYDPSTVHYLRVTHNILGVLIGTLPQIPSQSVFLGLPLQLLPEEVHLLVQKGVAYIVNDKDRHGKGGDFRQKTGTDREAILAELRREGLEIARDIERRKKGKREKALREQQQQKQQQKKDADSGASTPKQETPNVEDDADDERTSTAADSSTLFSSSSHSPSPNPDNHQHQHQQQLEPHTITPTSTLPLPSPPHHTSAATPILPSPTSTTPARIALHNHLHSKGYTSTPGLRFGCHFSVYPGDPLRFHSHFLANAYGWDEEIDLIDLVGGGRLGTGVKKGWLVGGVQPAEKAETEATEEDGAPECDVRCFCIEWAGM